MQIYGNRLRFTLVVAFVLLAVAFDENRAQTRIMPLGDSITQGGQSYASYRYDLWSALDGGGFVVDFVGRRDFTNSGAPNMAWYPDYFTMFDRDHEGYWGWTTDQIAGIVLDAATTTMPDVVLVHLGTNDIGQTGAAGVTNADTNLRLIIDRLRSVNPDVTILLAQVIPIGPGTSYFSNEAQVVPLNAVIAAIVGDMSTGQSPVVLVDQYSNFDLMAMMQSDGLHPNLVGEAQIAAVWQTALETILPDNTPPNATITVPIDGSSFAAPPSIGIVATADDMDGTVTQVSFFSGTTPLGTDTTAPYEALWIAPPLGSHVLTAVATDDEGATRTSPPVAISVLPLGSGVPLAVLDPSFEAPILIDGDLASGPGTVGSWDFTGTLNTFVGVFDPPAGSYPEAAGSGTPIGADGENVAFLFNNGGPGEIVVATQLLGETLQPDSEYVLAVAIGKFLADQPYVFSTFGGYRVELLAGTTVIAFDMATVDPPFGEFRDALAAVSTRDLPPVLLGQALSIRLRLSTDEAPRSTHFDNVRLTRFDDVGAGRVPGGADGAPLLLSKNAIEIALDWSASCLVDDTDFAIYEGTLGDYSTHTPRDCTTAGATSTTFEPLATSSYFLIVPRNATREGSHGLDGSMQERSAGQAPCLSRRLTSCP